MSRIINYVMFTALSFTGSLVLFEQGIRPMLDRLVVDNFATITAVLQNATR